MKAVSYASACGSLMYAMLCTRLDICFAVGMGRRYQSNPGQEHWSAVKIILKYLRRTKEYMLVYGSSDLLPLGYTDSDFQIDKDKRKSTSGCVFTLGGGALIWRSVKQKCIADSTMEVEYVAASEAAKEAIWFRNFLLDLDVVPNFPQQIMIYCDNTGAVIDVEASQAKIVDEAGQVVNCDAWVDKEFSIEMDAVLAKFREEYITILGSNARSLTPQEV
ncbi:secreted RxLR effector protein 161-like [Apium graveolens]|uniref:secreted RxLR effector protein 161-like n=1 Tax=Apium graveolens TaxID=4045 RepID=UPI003D7B883E